MHLNAPLPRPAHRFALCLRDRAPQLAFVVHAGGVLAARAADEAGLEGRVSASCIRLSAFAIQAVEGRGSAVAPAPVVRKAVVSRYLPIANTVISKALVAPCVFAWVGTAIRLTAIVES
jgi:hypothetical protein